MVHRLCSQEKKGKLNILKRRSCHLKMVGKFIRLVAPLRPSTDDGDKNGTADNANIVHQIKSSSPSMLHHHNHRRGRMTNPATKQVPNDKGCLLLEPREYKNNNNNNNNDGNNSANRGLVPPQNKPTVILKRAKNSPPVRSRTLPPKNNRRQCQKHSQAKNNHHYDYHHYQRYRATLYYPPPF